MNFGEHRPLPTGVASSELQKADPVGWTEVGSDSSQMGCEQSPGPPAYSLSRLLSVCECKQGADNPLTVPGQSGTI